MRSLVAFVLACTLGHFAFASPSDDEAGAKRMLDEYFAAYPSLDAHRVAQYFDQPHTLVTAEKSQVMANRAEVEAALNAFFPQLKARGYGHSEAAASQVRSLDDGLVFASVRVIRYKTDGSVLQTLGATYLLRRAAEGWRIAVITIHPASTVILK